MSKPQDERKIYGLNACLSFYQRFPDQIIRAWLSEDAAKRHFGPLMKQLARDKKAYHLADEAELEKVTESSHHEGVCLLVQDLPVFSVDGFVGSLPHGKPACLIALDGVSNPHNLGAIMRVAAHFGVNGILTTQPQLLRSGSAIRTAEGGATRIMVVATDNLVKALQTLKKRHFTVMATSSHESGSVYEAELPDRLVLVLGEEQTGVSAKVLQVADRRVAIAGTGWVESLNVSVATGILLSEFWRQHHVLNPVPVAPRPARKPGPSAGRDNARKPRPQPGAAFKGEGRDRGKTGAGRSRPGPGKARRSGGTKPGSRRT